MKRYSLTGWFFILLLPLTLAQELTLLEPTEISTPSETTNPLLEYVLAADTSALCDLLAEGMNPNFIIEDGQTVLHYTKNPGIASLLIDYGAEVNAKDNYHNTPLHHAVSSLNEPLTDLLLQEGANANIQNKSYYTPLLQCLEETNQPGLRATITGLLLEHGANPNVSTQRYKNTPLYLAIQSQNLNAVKSLLEHDADPNTIQGEAGAPLDLASRLGDTLIINSLLDAGATHLRLREELLQAMYESNLIEITELVRAGLDLNFQFDDIQLSPLHAGIKYMQSPTVVQLFLEKGALPDFGDSLSVASPLHLALDTESELPMFELLLEHDANFKRVDGNGKSVLFKAVELQNQSLVALLLEAGADPSFTVGEQSVEDVARASGNSELLELFELKEED